MCESNAKVLDCLQEPCKGTGLSARAMQRHELSARTMQRYRTVCKSNVKVPDCLLSSSFEIMCQERRAKEYGQCQKCKLSVEFSVEICCWDHLFKSKVWSICWNYLLNSSIEISCWDYLLWFAVKIFICCDYLLRSAVEIICSNQKCGLSVEINCWDYSARTMQRYRTICKSHVKVPDCRQKQCKR